MPLKIEADGRVFPQSGVGKGIGLFEQMFQPPTVTYDYVPVGYRKPVVPTLPYSRKKSSRNKLILTNLGQPIVIRVLSEGYRLLNQDTRSSAGPSLNSFIVANQ